MMREIVTPAALPPAALAELKDWLGITTSLDDAALSALLATAVDVCADFTGLIPLACQCEEMLALPTHCRPIPPVGDWQNLSYPADWRMAPRQPGWHLLSTRPVRSFTSLAGVLPDGTRVVLSPDTYELRLDAEGGCGIRVNDPGGFYRAVASFSAGHSTDWAHLPVQLRHGIIRLAAHQHRTRETVGADALPPASVAALWRPWRRVRLV